MIKKTYKTLRRVTLTGPMEEIREAQDWLDKNGYGIRLYSGPAPIRGHYKVDPTKFKIVSEKEI